MTRVVLNVQKLQYVRAWEYVSRLVEVRDRKYTVDGKDVWDFAEVGTGTTCVMASLGSPEEPEFCVNPLADIYTAIDAMHRSAVTLLLRQPCWRQSRPPKSYMSIYPAWFQVTTNAQHDKDLQRDLSDLFAAGNGLCGHPSSDKPLAVTYGGFLIPKGQDSQETFLVDIVAVIRFFRALTKLWRDVLRARGMDPIENPEQHEHLVDVE